jgi:uncharacterized membrane protein
MNKQTLATKKKDGNIFLRMHPWHRILISLILSMLGFLFIINTHLNLLIVIMIVWDAFAFLYLLACWIVLFTRPTEQMREVARKEDLSRAFLFFFLLITSFASMFTVLLLILSKEAAETALIIYIPVAIAGMLLSWIMVHTMFAFHYAHVYYEDDEEDPGKHAEGLDFPKEKKPDYLDFAYFSFVIGMTFQVSDVEINSKKLRRIVLVHGLLSFGLNTFVVALTINLIAGLRN